MPVEKKSGLSVCIHRHTSPCHHVEVFRSASSIVEISRCKVQAVWWMGEKFPAKLLQELSCDKLCGGEHCHGERLFSLCVYVHIVYMGAVMGMSICAPMQ